MVLDSETRITQAFEILICRTQEPTLGEAPAERVPKSPLQASLMLRSAEFVSFAPYKYPNREPWFFAKRLIYLPRLPLSLKPSSYSLAIRRVGFTKAIDH